MFQFLGDGVPQIPCRGFAPGPHWGSGGLCPPDPLTHFAVPPPQYVPQDYAYAQKDKSLLEKVQQRFTRLFPELRSLSYINRLKKLKLWTLEEQKQGGFYRTVQV